MQQAQTDIEQAIARRALTTKPKPGGKKGRATETDRLVGENLRKFRRSLGISQERLGDAIEVTFQQVQKYENGTNRISAGKLKEIADLMDIPVGDFYAGDTDERISAMKRIQGQVIATTIMNMVQAARREGIPLPVDIVTKHQAAGK